MAKTKTKSRFGSFITDKDAYFGANVSVNFNGSSRYKTTFGGVVSIIATFICLLFAAEKMVKLATLSTPNKFRNTVYHNLDRDMGH